MALHNAFLQYADLARAVLNARAFLRPFLRSEEPIMIPLRGKYNTAKVFTDNIEQEAVSQIINLLNQEFVYGSKIRIMPDAHAGAGCTIGTTMTITDKVVPNLVGVDIGCGMETVLLADKHVEL